ncbi:transposase [Acinetobacter nectaris]|nr:transposase [Acinetobacter nectaris]MCF9028364.1 transposase [Acinetobacter nectaris]
MDQELGFIDGSYIRMHQHAGGARYSSKGTIGKSRGGSTTKIHLATDANGLPIDFKITGETSTTAKLQTAYRSNPLC